jgi:subtilisin family serine protease
VHLERSGVRRRLSVLVAIAAIAIVAAACLPPAPPPPPPTTTTTTTTAPPQPICGAGESAAATALDGAGDDSGKLANQYVAVVAHNGRSKVLTRHVESDADIARFRADAAAQGEVTSFAPDGEVQALAETPTWGFIDSGFATAWGNPVNNDGTGIRVAVLDTGISKTHPDLTGHFTSCSADIVSASDTANPPSDATDPSSSGHGTHVAGIVAATANNGIGVEGGAPGVTLIPVRVLGAGGAGAYSDVAAGILWAADVSKGNAQVITMSLGGKASDPTVTQAIADIENPSNVNYTHPVITVAAGNTLGSPPLFPASLANATPQMISVSGLCKVGTNTEWCTSANPWPADAPYQLAGYSSNAWSGTGTPTGISAPGTQINSTLPTAVAPSGYGLLSGTSMATPFVAAAAALVVQHCPSDTAAQVVSRLENSAHDLGPAGVDTIYGYGKLDVAAAVASC